MALILDGKRLAKEIRVELKQRLETQLKAGSVLPSLAVFQVGDDLASTVYIRAKKRACEEIGYKFKQFILPSSTTMAELREAVNEVNNDRQIHGLLVQSPLPDHLNEIEVQRLVSPYKDVDCFHPENVGLMYIGQPRFYPCTAGAVLEMLLRYDINPAGKHAVIIGRSVLVGRPLAIMLASYGRGGNATVTLCHSRSTDIESITRTADILIPAVGVAELVKEDWVKPGAVVIDVGINRMSDSSKKSGYRLVGDVAFDEVEPKSSAIAPVPGGVGPMTVAILSRNLMLAAGLDAGV